MLIVVICTMIFYRRVKLLRKKYYWNVTRRLCQAIRLNQSKLWATLGSLRDNAPYHTALIFRDLFAMQQTQKADAGMPFWHDLRNKNRIKDGLKCCTEKKLFRLFRGLEKGCFIEPGLSKKGWNKFARINKKVNIL